MGDDVGDRAYQAEITWTTHGVPHVKASDLANLGFGQGWACARDHFAAIADHALKVRSERAKHFGRGDNDKHLHSDLGYLALETTRRAEQMRSRQADEIIQIVEGYAAGVNAWFAEAGREGVAPWCRDADWIRPLSALDLWRVYVDLSIMASGRNLVEYIGSASPPGVVGHEPTPPAPPEPLTGEGHMASNGWALGSATTYNGRGMVMANPHFPWWGEGRFWECHLTVPGDLDVYGVALAGTPLVQMGFNEGVAWSHTFSCGHRFCVYKLELTKGDATGYRYGDQERAMIPTVHRVEVAGGGASSVIERTLWSTHYGPMLNLPMLGWSDAYAFTYRDANLDNDRFLRQELAMDRARSVDDLKRAFEAHQGIPWVNTLAADSSGKCWYIDASSTPNLSGKARSGFLERLETDPITRLAFDLRVALLDGSDPTYEWQDEPGAPAPGLLPFCDLPQVERTDHVFNSNDPYWLPNAAFQLPEHQTMCGLYHRPLSARTRMNAVLLGSGSPVARLASRRGVTPDDVFEAAFGNHSLVAEELLDAMIERLGNVGTLSVDDRDTDLRDAVAVLRSWDRRFGIDSVGAVLFRELIGSFSAAELADAGTLWANPFDPTDPVGTPNGLASPPEGHPDPIAVGLARALHTLEAAGIDPATPLGEVQFADRGGQRVPIHGGYEPEGVANVIASVGTLARADLEPGPELPDPIPGRTERTGIRVGGYPAVYGVSFVMLVSFGDSGPEGRGLLVYGQSANPESPHHADQLRDWSSKQLRPLRFSEAAIAADSSRQVRTVRS